MGCHFLLQGIFPTQGSNPHLLSSVLAGGFFSTVTWEANFNDVTSAIYSASLSLILLTVKWGKLELPSWLSALKNPPAHAGDSGSIPDPGRSRLLWATKPVHHHGRACALEPKSCNGGAHAPQLLDPGHLETALRRKRSHCEEKPLHGH